MDTNMLVNGRIIKNMDLVQLIKLMGVYILVNGYMIINVGKEKWNMQMVTFIMEIGLII